MPDNFNNDDYHKVFTEWGTPQQLRRLLRWITPEELEQLIKEAGAPADVIRTLQAQKAQIARAEWWGTAQAKFKGAAGWIVGMGAALAVLRGLMPNLFSWWSP